MTDAAGWVRWRVGSAEIQRKRTCARACRSRSRVTSGSTIRSTSSEIFTDPSRGPSGPSDPSEPSTKAPNVRPARSHSSPHPHDPLEPRGHACRRAHDATLGLRSTAPNGHRRHRSPPGSRAPNTRRTRDRRNRARLRTHPRAQRAPVMHARYDPTRSPTTVSKYRPYGDLGFATLIGFGYAKSWAVWP